MKYIFTLFLLGFLIQAGLSQNQFGCDDVVCRESTTLSLGPNGVLEIDSRDFAFEQGADCVYQVTITNGNAPDSEILMGPDSTLTLDCDMLGEFTIVVTDTDSGNECIGILVVQDNFASCGFGAPLLVVSDGICSGYQLELDGEPIEPIVNSDCAYTLAGVAEGVHTVSFGDAYGIEAFNGISTLDLVLMMRGVLEGFDSPIQAILTDIDNDGAVSTIDILRTRFLILGILMDESDYKRAKIFRADHNFEDFNPFDFQNDFTQIEFHADELTDSPNNIEAYVYKIGDLNNNAVGLQNQDEDLTIRNSTNLEFENKYLIADQVTQIRFELEQKDLEASLISLDLANLEILDINKEECPSDLMSNIIGDELRLSYYTMSDKANFSFTLDVRSSQDGYAKDFISLSNTLDNRTVDNALIVSEVTLSPKSIFEKTSLMTVYPNPVSHFLFVAFDEAHSSEEKEITIYDINGSRMAKLNSSDNKIDLSNYLLNAPSGTYLLHASFGGQILQKRIVKL